MTKSEFLKKYRALTEAEKAEVMAHWLDVYNYAITMETMEYAEQRLLWMREA
jgi:hypothetical protein